MTLHPPRRSLDTAEEEAEFEGLSRALAKRTTGAERLCTTSEVLRMRAWAQDREVRCDGEAA